MKKLYVKSELTFALIFIVIYCVLQSLANPLSRTVGVEGSFHAVFSIALTAFLLFFIIKNGLLERYGLCRPSVPARNFLWYIPIILLVGSNLWNGAAMNLPLVDTVCYLCNMLCVGFLEEVLFRGFLFKAMAKDNVKTAVIISSVTFGIGHLLNLVNGRGMELVENLCQVSGAIAVGFLFVTIFYRGESLLPCIITHSAINMVSVFVNEAGLTVEKQIVFSLLRFGIVIAYAFTLTKLLPKKQSIKVAADKNDS